MRGFIIISVVLHISLCYAYPGNQQGVGAYAYQDSAGNRYGGTYDLGPEAFGPETNFIGPFGNDFQDIDTFFPIYFRNFEKFLQQRGNDFMPRLHRRPMLRPFKSTCSGITTAMAVLGDDETGKVVLTGTLTTMRVFGSDIANQRLALYAAQRAYDLTSYRVHHFSPFFRLPPFGGFPNTIDSIQSKFGMPNFGPNTASNSAFASSVAGPDQIHQVAAIDPPGSKTPNVDVVRPSGPPGKSNYYGVSSSSFVSSSNINGKQSGTRRSETIVNENGRITRYKVED